MATFAHPSDPGVQLRLYRGQADVLLTCLGCMHLETYPLERVIERLGEDMGIKAVAGRMKIACPKCGKWTWESRPAFRSNPGQNGTRAEEV